MLKLQWLQINKFRAVKPGTQLVFNPTFNVLLGQNGTGKTTLLNLVAAVVSSDFTALQDEEFELEYELASDMGQINATVRNTRSPDSKMSILGGLVTGTHIAEGLDSPTLSAELDVTGPDGTSTFLISFDGARVVIRRGDGAPSEVSEQKISRLGHLWVLLLNGASAWLQRNKDLNEVMFLVDLYAELNSERNNSRFDESVGYFDDMKKVEFHVVKSKESGGIEASSALIPDAFVSELESKVGFDWGAERLAVSGEQVSFLKEAARLFGFESAEALFELRESSRTERGEWLRFGGLRFLFSRSGGGRISEQHLSYGQKRMLAFMYYQAMASSVVIADELVNGLHHSWIRACIEMLGERQVFLTSQNPLLLDYLSFDSPEQVRSTFVLCSWGQGEGGGQMLWEDMSQEAAEDFFASYKVGFQQVGELLQSKGLW